jgi:hypothetical protein
MTGFTTSGKLDTRPEKPISVSHPVETQENEEGWEVQGKGKNRLRRTSEAGEERERDRSHERHREKERGGRTTPTQSTITLPHQGVRYRLMGLNVHYGSHGWGHYVAFRRVGAGDAPDSQDGEWIRISDTDVRKTSFEEVQRESLAGVFMLFYERVSPPTPSYPVYPPVGVTQTQEEALAIPKGSGFTNRLSAQVDGSLSSRSSSPSASSMLSSSLSSSQMLSRSFTPSGSYQGGQGLSGLSASVPSLPLHASPGGTIARTVGIGDTLGWREARMRMGVENARTASDVPSSDGSSAVMQPVGLALALGMPTGSAYDYYSDPNRLRSPSLSSTETVRPLHRPSSSPRPSSQRGETDTETVGSPGSDSSLARVAEREGESEEEDNGLEEKKIDKGKGKERSKDDEGGEGTRHTKLQFVAPGPPKEEEEGAMFDMRLEDEPPSHPISEKHKGKGNGHAIPAPSSPAPIFTPLTSSHPLPNTSTSTPSGQAGDAQKKKNKHRHKKSSTSTSTHGPAVSMASPSPVGLRV